MTTCSNIVYIMLQEQAGLLVIVPFQRERLTNSASPADLNRKLFLSTTSIWLCQSYVLMLSYHVITTYKCIL